MGPGGPGRCLKSLPEAVASFSLSMGPWRGTGTPSMTIFIDFGHASWRICVCERHMAVSRLSCALQEGDPSPQFLPVPVAFSPCPGSWASGAWRLLLLVGLHILQSGSGKGRPRGLKKKWQPTSRYDYVGTSNYVYWRINFCTGKIIIVLRR